MARIAFCKGRPAFSTLYLCGVLFGLYEAYITKVIWTGWDNHPVPVLGVSAIAFPLLALWYHPFISFMLPLAFLERYATGWQPGEQLMPNWVQRRFDDPRTRVLTLIAFGAFMGFYHAGVVAAKPTITFFSAIDSIWLLIAVLLWRRHAGKLSGLLPSGRGFVAVSVLLAAYYIVGTFILTRDKLPGMEGQATIWAVYAIVIASLIRSCRLSQPLSDTPLHEAAPIVQDWPWLIGAWFIASLVPRFVPGLTIASFVLCSLAGLAIGVWATVKIARELQSPPPQGARTPTSA